jgi:hypothetical protein
LYIIFLKLYFQDPGKINSNYCSCYLKQGLAVFSYLAMLQYVYERSGKTPNLLSISSPQKGSAKVILFFILTRKKYKKIIYFLFQFVSRSSSIG